LNIFVFLCENSVSARCYTRREFCEPIENAPLKITAYLSAADYWRFAVSCDVASSGGTRGIEEIATASERNIPRIIGVPASRKLREIMKLIFVQPINCLEEFIMNTRKHLVET